MVSNERLIERAAVLGDQPPRSRVPKVLHNLVSQLRKILGFDAIETRPGGYVLCTPPDAVDVDRVDRLAGEGRRHAAEEDWEAAAANPFDGGFSVEGAISLTEASPTGHPPAPRRRDCRRSSGAASPRRLGTRRTRRVAAIRSWWRHWRT